MTEPHPTHAALGPSSVIDALAAAHQREDVAGYLALFAPEAIWVSSRGVVYRGRESLRTYLESAIPGGLGSGTVRYVVESVHQVGQEVLVVVVEQTYLNAAGQPRDERAGHTHSYVVAPTAHGLRIVAGQNTVRS